MNRFCILLSVMALAGCGQENKQKEKDLKTPKEATENTLSEKDVVGELENMFNLQSENQSPAPPEAESCVDKVLNDGKVIADSKNISLNIEQGTLDCVNDAAVKKINYISHKLTLSCQDNQGFEGFNNKSFSDVYGIVVNFQACKTGMGTVKGSVNASLVSVDNTQLDAKTTRATPSDEACKVITDSNTSSYHFSGECLDKNDNKTTDLNGSKPLVTYSVKSEVSLKNAILDRMGNYTGGSYDVSIGDWKGSASFDTPNQLSYKLVNGQKVVSGKLNRQTWEYANTLQE